MKQKKISEIRKNINGTRGGKNIIKSLEERQVIAQEKIAIAQKRIADFLGSLLVTDKGRPSLVILPKLVAQEKNLFERAVTALEQSATAKLQEAEVLTK